MNIVMLLLFFSFFSSDIGIGEKLTNNVMCNFSQKMKREKKLQAGGIGGGIDHETGKHNLLQISFDIEDLPNVSFARKQIVEVIESFLLTLNNDLIIREYISYPFNINNVHISLISSKSNGPVKAVFSCNSNLYYYKDDPEKSYLSIDVHEESYNDALRIVNGQL